MQIPSTPCASMQSSTRRCPSRSSSPDSVNGVGAIGNIPVNGLEGLTSAPEVRVDASLAPRRPSVTGHDRLAIDRSYLQPCIVGEYDFAPLRSVSIATRGNHHRF